MHKQEKPLFVANLTEELKSASSVVLVDYTGLNVKMQQDLKKRLKKVGANLTVVKNTLFKLAGKGAKVPEESLSDTVLSGATAMIITEKDPIAPLSILAKFTKEKGIPQMKVGIIEGSFQDKTALEILSSLPGKDFLYAQAVGAISAPINGLLYTMQAKMQDLIGILRAKVNEKDNG